MGISGMSFGSLLLIFLIVALLFGTKRLRHIGEDLGAAMRSFRKGLSEAEAETKKSISNDNDNSHV